MHDLPLITTIATAFTAAWVLGLITQRLGLSPIVGYLLAGVLIGPHTPGIVADIQIAQQLAEVGVILLMFGVGLHFHLNDLLAVKSVAVPGAVGQSLVATLAAMLVFDAFGVPMRSGAVIGMAMAVASTVVLMRVLMDANVLNSPQGHVAVGWLLVEDVFTVIVLVLIPILGSHGATVAGAAAPNLLLSLGIALLKLLLLVLIVMLAGSRVIPWALVQVARVRSRELFTLTVLVFSIAIAAASYSLFGASMALGAFLAGMVVGQSPVSQQAAADALPMRDAFAVIFFVSVGMLFNPMFVVEQPVMILAGLGIILIIKPLTALVIVALLGHSARTALTVAIGLAQIGEFSFILSELARRFSLMPDEGHNLLVAGAIISITLNPMLFRALPVFERMLQRFPRIWTLLNVRAERRLRITNVSAGQQVREAHAEGERLAIVVGYGPVGRSVDRLLRDAGLTTVIVDLNMDTILALTNQGRTAVWGDASRDAVLRQAGALRASHLVLTLPHATERAAIVLNARNLNPKLRVLVRAHYISERGELERAGATAAIFEEHEAALGLSRIVLADTGASREIVERSVRDLQLRLILDNVSNLSARHVRSIMVPWTRVQWLSRTSSREEVMRRVTTKRFSRWPVLEPGTGKPTGYLLTKDLLAEAAPDADWRSLIRPLRPVSPDDDIESTLLELQRENASLRVVEEDGAPVGLITIEDILEQVVGRLEDEYPRAPQLLLSDALQAGGVVLDLAAHSAADAITELVDAIPADLLPTRTQVAAMALAREKELPTDVGYGVAIPHAQCRELTGPVVVFGRAPEGIIFNAQSVELVRLVFLLITPVDRPDLQVSMLGKIARVAGKPAARERLLAAATPSEVHDSIRDADA